MPNPWTLAVACVAVATLLDSGAAQSAAPSNWSATERSARELVFSDRHKEAIALLAPVVKAHPGFADGHAWIGTAYESMGRAQATTNPGAALGALETAARHFRQAFDLGGGTTPDITVRALIDLLALLRRSDERRTVISAAATRFRALPVAHWYAVRQALEDGIDLTPSLRAARAGIPAADVDARLDLAGYLAGLADGAAVAAQRTIVSEVQALCEQAVKLRPTDGRVAREAERVKGQLAVATTAVDRSQGPPANEDGAQATLRAIASAQIMYSVSCANGFYATTFEALGRTPAGASAPYLPADLVPAAGGLVLERDGYSIELTAVPDRTAPRSCNGVNAGDSARSFVVTARPVAGRSGRSFRIDQEGTLTATR